MKSGALTFVLSAALFLAGCASQSKPKAHHKPRISKTEQIEENVPDATPTPTPHDPLMRPLDPVGQMPR